VLKTSAGRPVQPCQVRGAAHALSEPCFLFRKPEAPGASGLVPSDTSGVGSKSLSTLPSTAADTCRE
jgi:hypothetical protein